MEVWSLGDPLDVDGVKLLRSETRNGVLNHKSLTFLVTRTLGGFAIAIENGVYLVDESLDLNSGMVGSFTPKLLSSDEAGRLYLVVDSHDGHELWVLAPNGERLITHTHPANEGAIVAPPLVGFDHSIYLLTASRAYALDPSGALRWECALDGPLGGAVVTADNRLVVSAGNSVSTFELVTDDDGEESIRRRSLLTIEGQRFGSAPILTPDGLLLVASDEALFCLEPKPPADPS
jgi:outer membrane protein assembly factor BamB